MSKRRRESQSPPPLFVDTLEAGLERAAVDANILRCLRSPEPQLRERTWTTFAPSKYQSTRAEADLSDDPDTNDWAAALVAAAGGSGGRRASREGSKEDSKDSKENSEENARCSVVRFLAQRGRTLPPPLDAGRALGAAKPPLFSDGRAAAAADPLPAAAADAAVFCDLDARDADAALLAANWLAKLGLFWGWPPGFRLVSLKTTPASGERWDAYLYGHPSGRRYRSPNEFLPHVKWMAAGDLDRACLCKFCDGVLLKDPTSVQWIEYEGKEEDLYEEEENGRKEGTKEQEVEEQEDGSNLSTKDETSLEATRHISADLQLGIELAATEEDNVSMQEATTRLGSEADPMFPSLLSMDSNFTGINTINNDTPLATIDPAQLFMPPTTTGASPDKDWNGSDYDSENDGSYATSSDNSSSDDEKSDSSGSDNDLVDDDDDDDSGNEQEPEDPETNGDESQEDDEMEKESLFPDLENFNTKFRKSHLKKTQKSSSSSSNLIILNAQELSKSYIPCRKGEPVWYPSSHLNFQPPPKAGSRFNQEMPFWPCLVLKTPSSNDQTVTLIPLPLPTPSELSLMLDPSNLALHYPPILDRSTIKTSKTPSHYTPHPHQCPVFGPRKVPIAQLVQWRLMDANPPICKSKFVCADNQWQRRWNRGVIQAVGVSSSWEPIPSFPVTSVSCNSTSNESEGAAAAAATTTTTIATRDALDELGTVWRELETIRWGAEVITVGDIVHCVLPCPFTSQNLRGGGGAVEKLNSSSVGQGKHRLMKVSRIVYRSPTSLEPFRDSELRMHEDKRRKVGSVDDGGGGGGGGGEGSGGDDFITKVLSGRRKLPKVIVEGDVYAFRVNVGWILVGRKRCTMKRVVIGRRFGSVPHVDGTPQLPKTNMELEEVGDGFGQVGLVVGEARNVWDSWVSFDGKGEDEGQGGLGTFVEVVRGLENQVVCFPNMGDLYDFNYEEQSSDEGGNEENEEEEEEDLVLDRRSVRVTATEAANLESSGDDDDYLTVELD